MRQREFTVEYVYMSWNVIYWWAVTSNPEEHVNDIRALQQRRQNYTSLYSPFIVVLTLHFRIVYYFASIVNLGEFKINKWAESSFCMDSSGLWSLSDIAGGLFKPYTFDVF